MSFFLVLAQGCYWNVLRVEGRRVSVIAHVADEQIADRIAVLLDRHGLVDVTLPEGLEA